jgi:hypothetical protein
LRSGKNLTLEGMAGFTTIPRGLWVAGDLLLDGCVDLETIGPELIVTGACQIFDCWHWDGRIPPDARIGGRVVTNKHPYGISLERWRAQHPDGEKAMNSVEPMQGSREPS